MAAAGKLLESVHNVTAERRRSGVTAAAAAEELPRVLQRELPNFMQPRVIHWRDALPLGATGKIDRNRLLAEIAA